MSFALQVDLYGPVRARLRGQAAHEQPPEPRDGRHVNLAVAAGLLPDGIAGCTVLLRSHCPAVEQPPPDAARLTQALIPSRHGIHELGRGLP